MESLANIKKELKLLTGPELVELISVLAKFSVENKKLLFFELYGRDNPNLFVDLIREELNEDFEKSNTRNSHVAKKSVQRIRRKLNKTLKLTKDKVFHIELVVYFCEKMKEYGYLTHRHPVIHTIYKMQISKIEKSIEGLHEDLRYDYGEIVENLKENLNQRI